MTYNVFSGTLNPAQSINQSLTYLQPRRLQDRCETPQTFRSSPLDPATYIATAAAVLRPAS